MILGVINPVRVAAADLHRRLTQVAEDRGHRREEDDADNQGQHQPAHQAGAGKAGLARGPEDLRRLRVKVVDDLVGGVVAVVPEDLEPVRQSALGRVGLGLPTAGPTSEGGTVESVSR